MVFETWWFLAQYAILAFLKMATVVAVTYENERLPFNKQEAR